MYEPYRNILKKKGIKQQDLINDGTINPRIAGSLKNNKSVTIETLEKICNRLNCQFNDLVEHIQEEEI